STTGSASSTTAIGSAARPAQEGASCKVNIPATPIGAGQVITAVLSCTTPLSDKGGMNATVDWGDGTTPSECPGTTPQCTSFSDGLYSESVILAFTHSYNTPNSPAQASYPVTIPVLKD